MIGGEDDVVAHLDPIFATLAPGVDAAPRTPGRDRAGASTAEQGYLHCGPNGAGHFVKMVHNGIEYGIMAAYAEGLEHPAQRRRRRARARRATPRRRRCATPEYYQYDDRHGRGRRGVAAGQVVGSWLLDLTAAALLEDPDLAGFSGRVSDSGEGRWTALAAIDEGVPAHVLSAALFERFSSRGEGAYANRLLSAMRKQFGGHAEKTTA